MGIRVAERSTGARWDDGWNLIIPLMIQLSLSLLEDFRLGSNFVLQGCGFYSGSKLVLYRTAVTQHLGRENVLSDKGNY
jgi:hypothetical protein